METLILRTVDGDDTLSVVEHPCADARALLALLAAGRRVLRTAWCGSTLEADVSVASASPLTLNPPGSPGLTGDPAMHDTPLRFADVLGALAIGCAFGALLWAFPW